MSGSTSNPILTSADPNSEESSGDTDKLVRLITEIGVARFASRISAGIIEELAGYKAIEQFVKADIHRPLFSKLGQAFLLRPNSYDADAD